MFGWDDDFPDDASNLDPVLMLEVHKTFLQYVPDHSLVFRQRSAPGKLQSTLDGDSWDWCAETPDARDWCADTSTESTVGGSGTPSEREFTPSVRSGACGAGSASESALASDGEGSEESAEVCFGDFGPSYESSQARAAHKAATLELEATLERDTLCASAISASQFSSSEFSTSAATSSCAADVIGNREEMARNTHTAAPKSLPSQPLRQLLVSAVAGKLASSSDNCDVLLVQGAPRASTISAAPQVAVAVAGAACHGGVAEGSADAAAARRPVAGLDRDRPQLSAAATAQPSLERAMTAPASVFPSILRNTEESKSKADSVFVALSRTASKSSTSPKKPLRREKAPANAFAQLESASESSDHSCSERVRCSGKVMDADAGRSATTRKSAPRPDPEEAEARQVDDAHESSPTSPAAGAASPKRTKRRSAKKTAAAAESADLAAMAEATSLAAAEAAAAPQVTEQSPVGASPKKRANGLRRLQGPGRPDNKAAVAKEVAPSVSVEPRLGAASFGSYERRKVNTAGASSGGDQTAVKTESNGKATSSNATTEQALGTCGMHPELFKLMKANASTTDRGAAWRQKQKDDMLKVVRADKSVFLKQLSAARTSISKELKNAAPPATTTPTTTATSPQPLLLPPDFREPLGVISVAQLAKFGAGKRGDRMLVSVYGTVFDVSEQAAKYCKGGEHSRYTGRDMTWALVTGQPSDCNRFFDIFKSEPAIWELNLECFCRTIVSHEQEYGAPVARLDVFEEEHKLLRPPAQATDCCVQ